MLVQKYKTYQQKVVLLYFKKEDFKTYFKPSVAYFLNNSYFESRSYNSDVIN